MNKRCLYALIIALLFVFVPVHHPLAAVNSNLNSQTLESITELEADITFNGSFLRIDVPIYVDNYTQRTLVPLRPVFEALGVPSDKIEWDEDSERVTVTHSSGKKIILILYDDYAYVNNSQKRIDTPARMIDDWIYVPLRFVVENLDASVNWNEADKLIEIILE